MQILKEPWGDTNQRSMQLEHDGEIIKLNVGFASNIGIAKDSNALSRDFRRLTRDVNTYWATLPYALQSDIFGCYKHILNICEEVMDAERLMVLLRKEMKKLMDFHPYDEVERFVRTKGTVKYPVDLKLAYGPGAPESPLTYLRVDYESLMAFTLLVRVAIPVLGEFLSRVAGKNKIIETNQKEIIACRLFSSTQLVETVPYIKLQTYMSTYVQDQKMTMAAIMGGMGTIQLPEWLLALTIVRRVGIIELPAKDEPEDPKNLVREIYNYVKSCVENPDKRFGGPIKPKNVESSSSRADDDNTSGAEIIKIAEKASEGQAVQYAVYVSNIPKMLKQIDPTIPVELINACVSHMSQNYSYNRSPAQTVLMKWALSATLNPRAIEVLEREELRLAAAGTQALLWHWGLYDLAILVTAQTLKMPEGFMVGVDTGVLTRQHMEKLIEAYPHFQIPKDRRWQKVNVATMPEQHKAQLAVTANIGRKEIGALSALIIKSAWSPNAPEELLRLMTLESKEFGYVPSRHLKSQLVDLVIKFLSTYK